MNRFKTGALLATLTALAVWVGGALGGESGMVVAFVLAATMNVGAWWWSDRFVLHMYGARELGALAAPSLHAIVGRPRSGPGSRRRACA